MAAESTLKNMALCLTAVCLFCSSVLAGVYALTAEPIKEAGKKATALAISLVVPEFDNLSEKMEISADGKVYQFYEVSKAGEVVAYAIESSSVGFSGPVKVMVGIKPDGVIYNTSVLSHSETPGLGAKCSQEDFRNQFSGFNPSEKRLLVKKDGGDVDAITAATITSRAFVDALEGALAAFRAITAKDILINDGGKDDE